jgi:hypothetical protein
MKILIFAPLLLWACATSSAVYMPDGNKGHSITCGGEYVWNANSWQACFQKASAICGDKGYEILSRD